MQDRGQVVGGDQVLLGGVRVGQRADEAAQQRRSSA
jgi:hypothetical protein